MWDGIQTKEIPALWIVRYLILYRVTQKRLKMKAKQQEGKATRKGQKMWLISNAQSPVVQELVRLLSGCP